MPSRIFRPQFGESLPQRTPLRDLLGTSVPEFIRLDATMSDVNSFVNVRDLSVFAENHNQLVLKKSRRCVISGWCYIDDPTDSNWKQGMYMSTPHAADLETGHYLFYTPALITRGTRKLVFDFYARENDSDGTETIDIYPIAHPLGRHIRDISPNQITIAYGASSSSYQYTLELPRSEFPINTVYGNREAWMIGVMIDTGLYGEIVAAGTLYASNVSGNGFVFGAETGAASTYGSAAYDFTTKGGPPSTNARGHVLVCTSDPDIEPRLIVDVSNGEAILDRPFNKLPKIYPTIRDTFKIYEAKAFVPRAYSVYEEPTSALDYAPTDNFYNNERP